MPTFPFIQVEGAIALPRMRPLDRIPATFGHEWTLTQPHFSLRAEIRALYAAIMRTVCLSAEAFREACRWDLHDHFFPKLPKPAAAPVRAAATVKASPPPVNAISLPHVDAPRSQGSRHAASSGTHRLAGGACAIGGAALLAWIVASHTPHGERNAAAVADTGPIRDAGNTASQRLADQRAAHERTTATTTTTETVVGAPQTSQAVDAAQRSSQRAASTAVSAPAARPSATRPDFAATNRRSAPPRATPSGRADKTREAAQRRASRGRVVGVPRIESTRNAARPIALPRVASPVTTHRTSGMDSEASDYSPRQPSVRQDDDYASIVTYAATYTAPRPASRTSVPVDSTDWVNHVSQRRVTEIPDRFKE